MSKTGSGTQHYRFGGHQSFALRTAWLPKAAQAIQDGEDVFGDPLRGVVRLGLGKNMVEALRAWVEAYGVAKRDKGVWRLAPIGQAVFGSGGYDRYLEDDQTLWLLHWNISTLRESPFFAWELLINRWSERFCEPSHRTRRCAHGGPVRARDPRGGGVRPRRRRGRGAPRRARGCAALSHRVRRWGSMLGRIVGTTR